MAFFQALFAGLEPFLPQCSAPQLFFFRFQIDPPFPALLDMPQLFGTPRRFGYFYIVFSPILTGVILTGAFSQIAESPRWLVCWAKDEKAGGVLTPKWAFFDLSLSLFDCFRI
jgi:hypothetical protein